MTFPLHVCWRVGLGAGAVLAPPQQPPCRGAVSPPWLAKLSLAQPWGLRQASHSQGLNYSYASKNPKPTPQTKKSPCPNKWITTTNPLWEKSTSTQLCHGFPRGGDLPGALLDCWSHSWQWQRCYLSPSLQTRPIPMIFKQHAERAARSWAAQSEQGFSQIIRIIMSWKIYTESLLQDLLSSAHQLQLLPITAETCEGLKITVRGKVGVFVVSFRLVCLLFWVFFYWSCDWKTHICKGTCSHVIIVIAR